jgi:hypothetical protein
MREGYKALAAKHEGKKRSLGWENYIKIEL